MALALAAGVLAFSLFIPWREPADDLILFGALDRLGDLSQTGWERWGVLDVGLVALAAGLLAWVVRPVRVLGWALGAAVLLAAACIAVSGFDGSEHVDPALGPFVAMAALGVAAAVLAADTL